MSQKFLDQVGEFDFLFKKYFPRLQAFARVIVKDNEAAKDIVQDSFIKAWEAGNGIEKKTFENYLFTLVRNRCLNYLRDQCTTGRKKHDLTELAKYEEIYRIDFIRDEPYLIFEKELKEKLSSAIALLPPRCKEVFIKSRFEGMKNREIAEELGINLKNVERHISAGLKFLKNHFADQLPMLLILEIISSGMN
ncbi:MAG: RNA polymerase sigma-70 factor [Marinilabiliaceae bacterium]|nr:RNA polymerase sigma-70 factor [Marinilabiliaceae bacterium]